MPKCKKDICKELAVYNRRWGHKRYCENHGHAYADKRDSQMIIRANMPNCASGISLSCLGKISQISLEAGKDVCHFCEKLAEELDLKNAMESRKQREFCDAKNVEELKAWISRYML